MASYDVDTNRRPFIYFGLAVFSVSVAPTLNSYVSPFLPEPLINYGFGKALSPFLVFSLSLGAYNLVLWRLPVIRIVSGIPYLGGRWDGTLERIGCGNQESGGGQVKCQITQTGFDPLSQTDQS